MSIKNRVLVFGTVIGFAVIISLHAMEKLGSSFDVLAMKAAFFDEQCKKVHEYQCEQKKREVARIGKIEAAKKHLEARYNDILCNSSVNYIDFKEDYLDRGKECIQVVRNMIIQAKEDIFCEENITQKDLQYAFDLLVLDTKNKYIEYHSVARIVKRLFVGQLSAVLKKYNLESELKDAVPMEG